MAPSSSANPQPSSRVHKPPRQWQRELLDWLWPILWTGLLVGSGIFTLWALVWLTRIPPLPNCEEISRLSSNRDRIYCAKAQARSDRPEDLAAAIALTAQWPKNQTDYEESQQILKESSQKILVLANRRLQAGDLAGATALANQVPPDTPLRKSAQSALYDWQQEWNKGKTLEASVATALQERNWTAASTALQTLKTLKSDYWLRDRFQYWDRQLQRENRSWENLVAARKLASSNRLKDLQEAIVLARQVDLGSQVWAETEQDVTRWSQPLLAYGLEQWRTGNLIGAIATLQQVPPDVSTPEAQTLLRLAHAKGLADKAAPQAPTYTPTYGHIFNLIEAIAAVKQIPTESPLYGPAQGFLEQWQAQLADLTRLQMAQTIAQLGQGQAYKAAIQQAASIDRDRPRRVQAQTLIAQWESNLERIADRPLLRQADQFAAQGTIPALQQAIAAASQVQLGRALRGDAQARIANWQQEIQEIEDRPLIDEAVALAQKDQLKDAIVAAQKVKPNRALYARAQTLIQDWTRTVQIREDQPLLNKAKDLAYQGSLTAAIETAAQIGAGRALYPEARRAIALWEDERAYIWSLSADNEAIPDETELSEPESE